MSDEGQPSGFFNRAIVVLFFVFTIPAALTLAGTYFVAMQGRVPGGDDTSCTVTITEDVNLRVDIYAYTAGLVEFETQTVSIQSDGAWQELFSDTIPVPQSLICENAVQQLDDGNFVIQNQKSLAWSADSGATWNVYSVCDEPRLTGNRCDAEALSLMDVNLSADGNGTLIVIESAVDEFGEPQRDEGGNLIPDEQWQLETVNYGATWRVVGSDT